jgi:hypothetical protein
VIVLNPNMNYVAKPKEGGKGETAVPIRGNDSPIAHALYVFDNFVVCTFQQMHMP